MSVAEIWDAVRRHPILIAFAFLAPVAIALVYSVAARPSYGVQARSFVSFQSVPGDATSVYQGAQFATSRVQSYVGLVDSPAVLDAVVKEMHLPFGAAQLAQRVQASSPAGTTLLDVHVSDTSSERAAGIANSVATVFGKQIEEWERVKEGQNSPVLVTLAVPAVAPSQPTWPRPEINLVLGMLAGSILALVLASVFVRRRQRVESGMAAAV